MLNPQTFIRSNLLRMRDARRKVTWFLCWLWHASYRVCLRLTEDQLLECGMTRWELFWQFIWLGLRYRITPGDCLRYRLYKKANHKAASWLILDQHLPHFHHDSNRNSPGYHASIALLADKYQFSQALKSIDIPTVQSECLTTQVLRSDRTLLFQKRSVFCIPNLGSQGKDAFLLQYDLDLDTYAIYPIHGESLSERRDIDNFLDRVWSRNRHFLVQPFLQDHPALQTEYSQHTSTTVRVITGRISPTESPQLLYLQLEIPNLKKDTPKQKQYQFYTLVPLHWQTLEIDPIFQAKHPEITANLTLSLPPLKEMLQTSIENCLRAHEALLPLKSVSFDVILTPQGPVIIEANFNWSITLLYFVILTDSLVMVDEHPATQWLRGYF